MTIALTSDDLGEVGETKLAYLCAQAGLVCNKSNRDRTGWDFVIEFPMPEPGGVPLEARLPTTCVVQLKSTAQHGSAGLKLSAVERIAKDPRPAFVVLFRCTPAGEVRAGYLIHLVGPALRRVLHRLRMAEARKNFDINKMKISFDPAKFGAKFEVSPQGLKSALQAACGDPAAYAGEKQRQLQQLGYEEAGIEGDIQFWVESAEHFTDITLGLKPIKPQRLQAYDNRFGIRLPYSGEAFHGLEELRLTPHSVGRCAVAVRGRRWCEDCLTPRQARPPS